MLSSALSSIVDALQLAKSLEQQLLVAQMIDGLSDSDRISVRDEATKRGVKLLPRNLFYNYQEQRWI